MTWSPSFALRLGLGLIQVYSIVILFGLFYDNINNFNVLAQFFKAWLIYPVLGQNLQAFFTP